MDQLFGFVRVQTRSQNLNACVVIQYLKNLQYLASNDGPTAPETGIFVVGRPSRPVIGRSEDELGLLFIIAP